MIRAGIIGANGYTGMELMRLLAAHGKAKVVMAASRSLAGTRVADTYPTLYGAYGDMTYSEVDIAGAAGCDVVFACLPHGESAEICGKLVDAGTRVIDLSADYRYDDCTKAHTKKRTREKISRRKRCTVCPNTTRQK